MKHHNGHKRINGLDGGKKEAKKQYHKGLRQADKELCYCGNDCGPWTEEEIESAKARAKELKDFLFTE